MWDLHMTPWKDHVFCLPKVKYSQLILKTSVVSYSVPLQDYKVPSIVVAGGGDCKFSSF